MPDYISAIDNRRRQQGRGAVRVSLGPAGLLAHAREFLLALLSSLELFDVHAAAQEQEIRDERDVYDYIGEKPSMVGAVIRMTMAEAAQPGLRAGRAAPAPVATMGWLKLMAFALTHRTAASTPAIPVMNDDERAHQAVVRLALRDAHERRHRGQHPDERQRRGHDHGGRADRARRERQRAASPPVRDRTRRLPISGMSAIISTSALTNGVEDGEAQRVHRVGSTRVSSSVSSGLGKRTRRCVPPHERRDAQATALGGTHMTALDRLALDEDVAHQAQVEGEHGTLHAADERAARREARTADPVEPQQRQHERDHEHERRPQRRARAPPWTLRSGVSVRDVQPAAMATTMAKAATATSEAIICRTRTNRVRSAPCSAAAKRPVRP